MHFPCESAVIKTQELDLYLNGVYRRVLDQFLIQGENLKFYWCTSGFLFTTLSWYQRR